jgi:hemerythrin-like metal-binding protein
MGNSVWKFDFKVGVDEIDHQHEMFIEHLSECIKYASGCQSPAIVRNLVANLKDYAAMHLAFEEELMKSSNYPEYDHHVSQHRYFESKVAELEDLVSKGFHEKVGNVVVFMREWLITHILEEDKKYAPHVSHTLVDKI